MMVMFGKIVSLLRWYNLMRPKLESSNFTNPTQATQKNNPLNHCRHHFYASSSLSSHWMVYQSPQNWVVVESAYVNNNGAWMRSLPLPTLQLLLQFLGICCAAHSAASDRNMVLRVHTSKCTTAALFAESGTLELSSGSSGCFSGLWVSRGKQYSLGRLEGPPGLRGHQFTNNTYLETPSGKWSGCNTANTISKKLGQYIHLNNAQNKYAPRYRFQIVPQKDFVELSLSNIALDHIHSLIATSCEYW